MINFGALVVFAVFFALQPWSCWSFGVKTPALGANLSKTGATASSKDLSSVRKKTSEKVIFNGGLSDIPQVVAVRATVLSMGFFDDIIKRFTTKATASHILIKGGAEAANRLEDLKAEIDNDPVKFAEVARSYSMCPSARQGGNLGEFGPGQMVKEFDTVVFNEDVGVVHGPVKTHFGYHLILINDRKE